MKLFLYRSHNIHKTRIKDFEAMSIISKNASLLSVLLVIASSVFLASEAQTPLVDGLSWGFYNSTCPMLESLVRNELKKVFKKDVGQAAGLLRLHFQDCFVQGCDGSVLLNGSTSGPSERNAPPNLTLRTKAFEIIENLRALVHKQCGRVVSCADITAIAARDSVFLSGGPDYDVPLGRRDGLNFATLDETLVNLPAPSNKTSAILDSMRRKNLSTTDAVALSGAHTIGLSHCSSFTNRLYPTQDTMMDKTLANDLKVTCPKNDTNRTTNLDTKSPNKFDNKYFLNLIDKKGLFTSDQDLYTDTRTRLLVMDFAFDQDLFFEKFVVAMIKMSQLSVLTGSQGEIRAKCSVRNSDNVDYLASVVPDEGKVLSQFK